MNNPVKVVVKRNFLTGQELSGLMEYTLAHETDFTPGSIIPDEQTEGALVPDYRRARVLFEFGEYRTLIEERIRAVLPAVLKALQRDPFPLWYIDSQITASNDGDFYKAHRDNGAPEPVDIPLRQISFVYYFHSEPKAFSAGQLRFLDWAGTPVENEEETSGTITPRQNTIVFFPSSYEHEVLPVICRSRRFADSRFTANGWLIRTPASSDE
jgi:Rps23 Pro-64 3,4-dihydroxylase Tpa1-like proline 4-hydroxylase